MIIYFFNSINKASDITLPLKTGIQITINNPITNLMFMSVIFLRLSLIIKPNSNKQVCKFLFNFKKLFRGGIKPYKLS